MSKHDIEQQLRLDDAESLQRIVASQEQGFVAFSKGEAVVPDVFHMLFDPPYPGDLHVKGARLVGGDVYVIKLATGFSENTEQLGIPNSQGLMIVGDARSGQPLVLLQDEGFLTDLRTALAGLIAARHLAPRETTAIGLLGTGIQARLQVEYLRLHTSCREVYVWGRTPRRVDEYARDMSERGYVVHRAASPAAVAEACNLIVTTTAAREPLLDAGDVRPGTHITAVGADAPGKQELDPEIFARASMAVVDSRSQCVHHGEIHEAVRRGIVPADALLELGQVIANPALRKTALRKTALGKTAEDSITIADLTGVGVQDLQIAASAAESILRELRPTP